MKEPKINIAICSSSTLYGEFLKKTIETFSKNIHVVSAKNSLDQINLESKDYTISYLLLRLGLPFDQTNTMIQNLSQKHPSIDLIIMTFNNSVWQNSKFIDAGAHSYHIIDDNIENLIDSISKKSKSFN